MVSYFVVYSSLDPEPLPPHYTSNTIRATLDYLPSCYFTGTNSSVITMLAKKKVSLNFNLFSNNFIYLGYSTNYFSST